MQRAGVGILIGLIVFGASFAILYLISRPVADLFAATESLVNLLCAAVSLLVAGVVASLYFRS